MTADDRSEVSSIGSYNNLVGTSDVSIPSGNTSFVTSLATSAGYTVARLETADVASVLALSEANVEFPADVSNASSEVSDRTYHSVTIQPRTDGDSYVTSETGLTDVVAYRHA